ncbi:MAG: hypothetical protein WDW38_007244 [Sanguina aurantia]
MKTTKGSFINLAALEASGPTKEVKQGFDAPLRTPGASSRLSLDNADTGRLSRLIIVSNHLPVRIKRAPEGWEFEWDEDALVAQAKDGIPAGCDVLYVGSLPVDVPLEDQEGVATDLKRMFNCSPVFMDSELKEKYYKGFCKQQLWPLFHYVLPMSPTSLGRFDAELWQAYVKANKIFCDKLVEEAASEGDCVWIHDYHLLVLPSLLRKRFNRIRCGLFLHSPFPSSEIFRAFPKREEILRSMLNTDLLGFHTFDYARHFLSCASRMLGIEHETSRGTITLDYYGRTIGIKIMPTGINPQRYLSGFEWDDYKWRRGELAAQLEGKTVLVGVDDMDPFKGIELKLAAFERLLDYHSEYRGNLVLVQITNPPRSAGRDITELQLAINTAVQSINNKYGDPEAGYEPVMYLERHVPLHERMAFYSLADVAVLTATRDGFNLVPYEYIMCSGADRDSPQHGRGSSPGEGLPKKDSMLVVSEFVGCSPSLSGAIRVNPWSVEATADGIFSAIKLPQEQKQHRHEQAWRYVSQHTVQYWAASYIAELQRVTKGHNVMKCYALGLGLDTFRMVALDANFRKLDEGTVQSAYASSTSRILFLDYDGTLSQGYGRESHSNKVLPPSEEVIALLRALAADPCNKVCLFCGTPKAELAQWFDCVPNMALGAEGGFFLRWAVGAPWESQGGVLAADMTWKRTALPILQQYQESTDGSWVEVKQSSLVWHYPDADPDFGSWQAKELLTHLEGVLANDPVSIVSTGHCAVEIRPQGVTKGQAVEHMLALATANLQQQQLRQQIAAIHSDAAAAAGGSGGSSCGSVGSGSDLAASSGSSGGRASATAVAAAAGGRSGAGGSGGAAKGVREEAAAGSRSSSCA